MDFKEWGLVRKIDTILWITGGWGISPIPLCYASDHKDTRKIRTKRDTEEDIWDLVIFVLLVELVSG